jgi:hypothetical protein
MPRNFVRPPLLLLSLMLMAVAMAGCGGIQVLSRDPNGGRLALQGDEDVAMEDAREEMDAVCGVGLWQIMERSTSSRTMLTEGTDIALHGARVRIPRTRHRSRTRSAPRPAPVIRYECVRPQTESSPPPPSPQNTVGTDTSL